MLFSLIQFILNLEIGVTCFPSIFPQQKTLKACIETEKCLSEHHTSEKVGEGEGKVDRSTKGLMYMHMSLINEHRQQGGRGAKMGGGGKREN